jgi:nitroreductase
MDALEAIRERRSVRAFKPVPVPKEKVEEVLRLTVNAPSANNLQPWEFVVVMDEERERLSRKLIKAYKEKQISCGSGAVKPLPKAIRERGVKTMEQMKSYVEKTGGEVDSFVNEGSCNFYGAPTAIIICIDDCFSARQFVDVGTAVAYLVLAAESLGLASCPVGLITDYAEEIKELLNIAENKRIVIGIALGYADRENPMAQFRSPRAELSELVRWI